MDISGREGFNSWSKTLKVALDTFLLITRGYKVRIKGKV